MPMIEQGGHCLIIAPTGSGKTEAAVLPLLKRFGEEIGKRGIGILYITPLRALNRDMFGRLKELVSAAGLTVGVRHGDTTQAERRRQARIAPGILVTTPETLQSILPTKTIGLALHNVKAVVVDEIHELYHNKRGAQLSVALERLEELAPGFQRVGISATVGEPASVAEFLCGSRKCGIANVSVRKSMRVSVELPTKRAGARLQDVMDKFGLDASSTARLAAVAKHISSSGGTLVFANTRQIVEALGSRLVYLNRVSPFGGIGVHHSSLDKEERIAVEAAFRNGTIRGIIATSSLELGIDIGSIDKVVQYGSPRQALRLAQRAGRSGHTHKGTANAAIIAMNPVDALESIAIVDNLRAGDLETFPCQRLALDVLSNQICGIALDKGSIDIGALAAILERSFVYRGIERDRLIRLLQFMMVQRLIGFDGNTVTAGSRTRMHYYEHLSVIPDVKRLAVKNIFSNRIISTLDERFVADKIDEGSVFITKGLPWKVVSIDDVISVEPSTELEAAVPDWTGEDIPVSGRIASTVLGFFADKRWQPDIHVASAQLHSKLEEFIRKQNASFAMASGNVIVETLDNYAVLYTGLGTQANEALSRLMANEMSIRLGRSISVRSSPYMIFFEVGRNVNLQRYLEYAATGDFRTRLESAVRQSELFRYKFVSVAKLFGVIDRDATVSRSLAKRIIRVFENTPIAEETMRELMENYFDIKAVEAFLHALKVGRITVTSFNVDSASALTRMILNSAYYTRELIAPLTPNAELVESFAKFIMEKEIRFLCTYCGFRFSRRISAVRHSERLLCPQCGSPMLTLHNDDSERIVSKRLRGKRLTPKEKASFKDMMRYAGLFDAYGGKAAVALSVYGVGLKTAARALMMLRRDEKDFFVDLIEAQKTFIRTKKYWSV